MLSFKQMLNESVTNGNMSQLRKGQKFEFTDGDKEFKDILFFVDGIVDKHVICHTPDKEHYEFYFGDKDHKVNIINEALSEDEVVKRMQDNQKIYNEMLSEIHSFNKVMDNIKSIVNGWSSNPTLKPESEEIKKICKNILDLNKQFKEMK